METLDYNTLYTIIKYQYDKLKLERDSQMTNEELIRRDNYDNTIDFLNNPSFERLTNITSKAILKKEKKILDDPSTYLYYSKNYI